MWIDNPFFGYRFFAPRLARTPPGAVIDREKPPGTIRVFVLGESAAMGDPLDEFGPARQLACLLEARYPGKRFEVVNAAMTAINSHVIAEIAREAAWLRPADVGTVDEGGGIPAHAISPRSAAICATVSANTWARWA